MTPRTVREQIAGPAGRIECAIDRPADAPLGLAIACHPHPQFGGTLDNKVVQTIARACLEIGWASVRFNFRGVGASEGVWDEGRGELDDALAVVSHWRAQAEFAGLPFLLAGFSFGGYVAVETAHRLGAAAKPRRLVLVGPSTEKQPVADVPADTLVIHPRRERRRRPARRDPRLGPAAESAGHRLSGRRPLLPRPDRAAEKGHRA
jgi:alpha/beta superfamily hydrolase